MGQLENPTNRFWQWFVQPLRRAEEDSRAYLASREGKRFDAKTFSILILAAAALTLQHFLGFEDGYLRAARFLQWLGFDGLAEAFATRLAEAGGHSLARLSWWVAVCVTTYFALPALLLRLGLHERLRDYGIKPHGALAGWPVYVAMLAIMVPLVAWMSGNARFQETYPFYELAPGEPLWPAFWCWEAMYALQFFALEFFFRGFLLHGTKQRFGAYSIPVMVVPYCMIHFHKPMPEAFASIVAGLALGYMSLRTRSIWLGAAIHVTVALSMDCASLWRQGRLGY
jgi:membrane protease YdiL (CAAX protease family)